uniref:Replication protein A subunit n=1 Tax=Cannabis sativa TaxID=3483 RepID=A0A803P0X1_CANSA
MQSAMALQQAKRRNIYFWSIDRGCLHLKREDKYQELVEAYVTFGCGEVQSGSFLDVAAPNGLFGLGMEKISVPSILSREGFIANSFSMCFGQDGVGRISFGDKGSLDQQETPFNLNPSQGFENQMEKCMGACDCIITKAGPGTIAEALIRGLPIILNGYIPRQCIEHLYDKVHTLITLDKPQSNDLKYQLIPHITRGQTNWTAKVIAVEKTPPRQSRNSVKYQNLLLIDPQGNHIEATIYQADIQALHQTLHMTKAYAISNANVKDCKLDYKKYGDLQWVITGKTKIKELQENYDDLLMSTYNFVPLSNIQQYIDLPSKEINLIAAVIDIRPKRQIHNRHGEATIQELVLMDNEFNTATLTMWNNFVDNECAAISNIIHKKPIMIGTRLKVLEVAKDLRAWITRNNCILNERITQKAYLLPATNLSPPSSDQITDISKINDMLNMQTTFWVKAIAKVTNYGQPFWYMACPLCNRITGSEYGETFHCLYCKNNDLKAVPRCRIDVELTDSSSWITATVFGEIAETLFSCNATTLMNTKIKASDIIPNELPELHDNKEILAYIKAVKQDSTEGWKFNITSFLNTTPLSNEELISNASTFHPNPTPLVILPEKKHKVTADDEEKKHETTNENGNNHKASNEDQMQ